jgi:hypothetical protein
MKLLRAMLLVQLARLQLPRSIAAIDAGIQGLFMADALQCPGSLVVDSLAKESQRHYEIFRA